MQQLHGHHFRRAAGKAIMQFYQSQYTVADKSPDNPVTDADFAADKLLHEQLLALLPEAGWLSEETADDPARLERRLVWVVDPLDGTKEFVMGIPEFSVSVGLVEDGEPVLAVIYNPPTGELFAAGRGLGVFYNGEPATVSSRDSLQRARVDASRSEVRRGEFEPFDGLFDVNVMGSIAYKLARVAAGQADATGAGGPSMSGTSAPARFVLAPAASAWTRRSADSLQQELSQGQRHHCR